MSAVAFSPEQLADAKAMAREIGWRIREARGGRETSEQSALALGMCPTSVRRIERGESPNVKLGSAMKLLRRYGLTLSVQPASEITHARHGLAATGANTWPVRNQYDEPGLSE